MSYQRNLSFIAALLALNSVSLPSNASDIYNQDALLSAIEATIKEAEVPEWECDPFIDAGCTLPNPRTPLACSDCNPSQLFDAFIEENRFIRGKKFVLPKSIDVDGTPLEFLIDPSKQDYSIFSIPTETGF